MKNFNGKAIYQPAGKAAEYAKWACNFYVGCSNGCTYCYLKKGRGAAILGGDKPTLKKCFRDESHALEVFEKELRANLPELQKHGLFFSFTTDPMLPETKNLTLSAAGIAYSWLIPVKILTKCTEWVNDYSLYVNTETTLGWRKSYAYGFTLTGHDELEPGASTNQERIEAMKKLHDIGFKTFASIEPVIDFESSYSMIWHTYRFCDHYKIGLMSGQKVDHDYYVKMRSFFLDVVNTLAGTSDTVYWKDSFTKHFDTFSNAPCNVNRDYNMFKEKKLTKSEYLKQVRENENTLITEPQRGAYDLNGVDGFCDKNKLK